MPGSARAPTVETMAVTASATSPDDSLRQVVDVNRRHWLVLDEPLDKGGTDDGPTPMELLPAALASCVGVTLRMYAERKGWALTGLVVHVTLDNGVGPPELHVTVDLPPHLDSEQRERLMVVAGKCPVHRVLAAGAVVSEHEVEQPVAA